MLSWAILSLSFYFKMKNTMSPTIVSWNVAQIKFEIGVAGRWHHYVVCISNGDFHFAEQPWIRYNWCEQPGSRLWVESNRMSWGDWDSHWMRKCERGCDFSDAPKKIRVQRSHVDSFMLAIWGCRRSSSFSGIRDVKLKRCSAADAQTQLLEFEAH